MKRAAALGAVVAFVAIALSCLVLVARDDRHLAGELPLAIASGYVCAEIAGTRR